VVKKARPHDFCDCCGSDLGEIPPPPPRCHHCRGTIRGHKGPWGVGRCKNDPPSPVTRYYDGFLTATLKAYRDEIDRMMMEDHSCTLAIFGGKR
jgi:predicted amidophosphoribosyltransferase